MPNSDQNSQSSSNEPIKRGPKRGAREARLPQSPTKKQRADNGASVYPVSSISRSGQHGTLENPIDVDADVYPSIHDVKIDQRMRLKASTVDSYLHSNIKDKFLIFADEGEGVYKFRLYTKDNYIRKNGPTDRMGFDNLRTIYRVPGEGEEYISRRQLYDIMEGDKADSILKQCGMLPGKFPPYPSHSHSIHEYPSIIVRIKGSDDGTEAEFYGSLPQPSDDRVFDHMVDQFGRENIWLQTRGVHYKDLDTYDRSEPWSDRGGFKLAIGWPKAIIRDDNGRFIDLRRYCNDRGSLNGSLKEAPHGGPFSPNLPHDAVVFVLKKDGEGYMSPQRVKQRYPSSFGTLLEAAGLPRYVADWDQREGPNVLKGADDHIFLSPDRIDHENSSVFYSGLSQIPHEPGHYTPEIVSLERMKMAAAQEERPIVRENIAYSSDPDVGQRDAEASLTLPQGSSLFVEAISGERNNSPNPEITGNHNKNNNENNVKKDAKLGTNIDNLEEKFTRKFWTDLDVDRSDMHRWTLASRVDYVKSIGKENKLSVPPNKDLIPSKIYWKQETRDEYEAAVSRGRLKERMRSGREGSTGRD